MLEFFVNGRSKISWSCS